MAFRIQRPPEAFQHTPSDKSQARMEEPEHLAFIRKLPSIISGEMPCEACHIRFGNPAYRKNKTPAYRKPDDCWVVPMTAEEHRAQHSMSEKEWWRQLGIDPCYWAKELHDISGYVDEATDLIMNRVRRGTNGTGQR